MAIALLALPLFQSKAQQLAYTPDIVLGHRSYTYLHNISYQFNDKLKVNNLTLFDTEYTKDKENIFFISIIGKTKCIKNNRYGFQ